MSRRLTPFKGTNVLWRLRAAARTGVTSPSWVMAAVTSVPPINVPPRPKKVPNLRLPIDRLVDRYEKTNPIAGKEQLRVVDGTVVSRSFVFAQKQHEFMKKGISEAEAYKMAEKALVEEEEKALKELKALTKEARETGAVPAMSSLNDNDDRWEMYQFWRGKLQESPYSSWPMSKQASLDHWLARHILGWQPHQTRYLGKEEFHTQLSAVRKLVFADIMKAYEAPVEEGGIQLKEEDLLSVRQERSQEEYHEWEERLVAKRGGDWPNSELGDLSSWIEENHDLVCPSLESGYSRAEDGERYDLRAKVVEWLAFPLLRPEFQGLPYMSEAVTRAFLEVAKVEAGGLRSLINGPLGKSRRKVELSTVEATVNDALPKLVVKVYTTVAVERPFTWKMLGYVLIDWIRKTPVSAFKNLPDLRSLSEAEEVAGHVKEKWQHLTERLKLLAHEEETSSLGEDIAGAYQAINELHRLAEEVLHANGKGGHDVDQEIVAMKNHHHGWIEEDLAVGEVLRKYDPKVDSLFLDSIPEIREAMSAREKLESDILETARLDGGWTMRERARLKFEVQEGLRQGDAYDQYWLKKRSPDDPPEPIEVNPDDLEHWGKEVDLSGLQDASKTEPSDAQADVVEEKRK